MKYLLVLVVVAMIATIPFIYQDSWAKTPYTAKMDVNTEITAHMTTIDGQQVLEKEISSLITATPLTMAITTLENFESMIAHEATQTATLADAAEVENEVETKTATETTAALVDEMNTGMQTQRSLLTPATNEASLLNAADTDMGGAFLVNCLKYPSCNNELSYVIDSRNSKWAEDARIRQSIMRNTRHDHNKELVVSWVYTDAMTWMPEYHLIE